MRIPRALVPDDCPAPSGPPARAPRRLKTWLDVRTLISPDMPVLPFSGVSNIPTHVPLDVLNNRVLIGRDFPVIPFPSAPAEGIEPAVTALDERVVVPQAAHLNPVAESEPFSAAALKDLVENDLLVTGEARLLPERHGRVDWDLLAGIFSVVFHVALILLLLMIPGVLSRYTAKPNEEALNQQNLGYVYLPKNLKESPKTKPKPQKPSDKMKIDIGALNKIAPPKPEVSRQQGPAVHPTPQIVPPQPAPPVQSAEVRPQPRPEPPQPKPQPRIESVKPNSAHPLILPPDMAPGSAIEQSLRAAAQNRSPDIGFQDQIPPPPSLPGGPGQEGGPGPGYLSGSVQMLTPTEGVDFTSYIQRLLAVVRRNWYAVMPVSARLGDKGRVMLRFKILRNGVLPSGEPILEMTSGKQPLDRAAAAAITASNPFEPLPQAFTGPYIELRFVFLYNLPINAQ
ncbi:MAG TPA: TonB C-terminal domain-containing protein [Patescibacteria group bacterium]|nr:TonB C-terminal domain-containing protein [Patescibacteria group bacterium]